MLKQSVLLFVLLFSSFTFADVYKWTDAQGNVHYGDKPQSLKNQEQQKMDIDLDQLNSATIPEARKERRKKLLEVIDEENQKEKEEAEKAAKLKQKRQRYCVSAKDRFKRYNSAGYLYGLDKDGNRVIYSDQKRQAATSKLKNQIAKYCK